MAGSSRKLNTFCHIHESSPGTSPAFHFHESVISCMILMAGVMTRHRFTEDSPGWSGRLNAHFLGQPGSSLRLKKGGIC